MSPHYCTVCTVSEKEMDLFALLLVRYRPRRTGFPRRRRYPNSDEMVETSDVIWMMSEWVCSACTTTNKLRKNEAKLRSLRIYIYILLLSGKKEFSFLAGKKETPTPTHKAETRNNPKHPHITSERFVLCFTVFIFYLFRFSKKRVQTCTSIFDHPSTYMLGVSIVERVREMQ